MHIGRFQLLSLDMLESSFNILILIAVTRNKRDEGYSQGVSF